METDMNKWVISDKFFSSSLVILNRIYGYLLLEYILFMAYILLLII